MMNDNEKHTEDEILLKIENLSVSYGGIKAVKNIDIDVPKGRVVTLIGAN